MAPIAGIGYRQAGIPSGFSAYQARAATIAQAPVVSNLGVWRLSGQVAAKPQWAEAKSGFVEVGRRDIERTFSASGRHTDTRHLGMTFMGRDRTGTLVMVNEFVKQKDGRKMWVQEKKRGGKAFDQFARSLGLDPRVKMNAEEAIVRGSLQITKPDKELSKKPEFAEIKQAIKEATVAAVKGYKQDVETWLTAANEAAIILTGKPLRDDVVKDIRQVATERDSATGAAFQEYLNEVAGEEKGIQAIGKPFDARSPYRMPKREMIEIIGSDGAALAVAQAAGHRDTRYDPMFPESKVPADQLGLGARGLSAPPAYDNMSGTNLWISEKDRLGSGVALKRAVGNLLFCEVLDSYQSKSDDKIHAAALKYQEWLDRNPEMRDQGFPDLRGLMPLREIREYVTESLDAKVRVMAASATSAGTGGMGLFAGAETAVSSVSVVQMDLVITAIKKSLAILMDPMTGEFLLHSSQVTTIVSATLAAMSGISVQDGSAVLTEAMITDIVTQVIREENILVA